WAALAGLSRQLAADLGPHRIRVAWLLSPGSPDAAHGGRPAAEPSHQLLSDAPPGAHSLLPNHQPTYDEIAKIAAFLASDAARTMTATEINLTGGTVID